MKIRIDLNGAIYEGAVFPVETKPVEADISFNGPLSRIPTGLYERRVTYGDPGFYQKADGKWYSSDNWESKNMVLVQANEILGYQKRLYMHKLVKPYFLEAMSRAWKNAPTYIFRTIGCFNPRKMRYNKDAPFSDHAFGIAFDINSDTNRAFTRREEDIALPFAEGWERYSDLPKEVVDAFESVGFEWGGRWGQKVGGFVDPMHFSLRKTK